MLQLIKRPFDRYTLIALTIAAVVGMIYAVNKPIDQSMVADSPALEQSRGK